MNIFLIYGGSFNFEGVVASGFISNIEHFVNLPFWNISKI